MDSAGTWFAVGGGGEVALPIVLLLPIVAALLSVVAGARHAPRIALFTMPIGLVVVATIACDVLIGGATPEYVIGGWAPPLGLRLRADGLFVCEIDATDEDAVRAYAVAHRCERASVCTSDGVRTIEVVSRGDVDMPQRR